MPARHQFGDEREARIDVTARGHASHHEMHRNSFSEDEDDHQRRLRSAAARRGIGERDGVRSLVTSDLRVCG